MTNREYLATLSDDELAEWLCRQMWKSYTYGIGMENLVRYRKVQEFLEDEYSDDIDKLRRMK